MDHQSKKRLHFTQGSNYFRQRLTLSLLSARPIKIEEIRSQLSAFELNVGVTQYEMSFVHLLDSLSNGSKFKINETGTEVSLIPGVLTGGTVSHTCDTSRPLSYYLEPILLLAPFCKKPLYLTLKGRIQNDRAGYNSIYKIKHAALPILDKFGLEVDIQVKSRGYDDSEVIFKSTVKKQLLTLRTQYNQEVGKVKKVRGLAYGFRVSPQMLSRIVTTAKGEFLPFLSDVFLTNDPVRGSKSKTPGYGLFLYAETTKGIVYAADDFVGREDPDKSEEQKAVVRSTNLDDINSGGKRSFELFPDEDEKPSKKLKQVAEGKTIDESIPKGVSKSSYVSVTSPEELGIKVARMLLKEIATQSRIDSVYQYLVLGLMALSPKDVSSVILGPITPFTVQFLRDLKTFFGVTFKIENYKEKKSSDEGDEDDDEFEEDKKTPFLYKLSCLGSGYINLNKTTV